MTHDPDLMDNGLYWTANDSRCELCGHTFRTRSAHKGDIRVEICSSCHPFFTGRQKLIDTEGRVDRFQKKYQRAAAKKK